MQTGDLLDEILFDREIESVRRGRNEKMVAGALAGEPQPREQCGDRLVGDLDAEETRDARGPHANGIASRHLALHVSDRSRAPSADLHDELCRALDCAPAPAEVDAALEAVSGVAHESQPARLPLDHGRAPIRALQQHGCRRVADPRVLAAHDSGKSQRLRGVGDEQKVVVEIEHLLVEQRELLTGPREAHDDRSLEQTVVVRVQRLAELEHHVIGDVDDRGDRANPAAFEALLHPFGRRRARVDALDRSRHETRARLRVFDAHFALCARGDRYLGRRRQCDGDLGERGDLARDSEHRQAIRAIGRELQGEQRVVEVERFTQVRPCGRVCRQRKKA